MRLFCAKRRGPSAQAYPLSAGASLLIIRSKGLTSCCRGADLGSVKEAGGKAMREATRVLEDFMRLPIALAGTTSFLQLDGYLTAVGVGRVWLRQMNGLLICGRKSQSSTVQERLSR